MCKQLLYAGGRLPLGLLCCWLSVLSWAPSAAAQYKNNAFGLDVAASFLTRPSVLDSSGNELSNAQLPVRLARGARFGGEVNLKLNDDAWWFSGRVNGHLLYFTTQGDDPTSLDYAYDTNALATIGTVFGIEALAGIRYYFFTDRNRPYLQAGVSYEHLFSFTGQDDSLCEIDTLCDNGGSFGDVFLPHTNIFALHLQPGIEFIVQRDIALSLAFDYQYWLVLNSPSNSVFTFILGMTFYG